MTGLLRRDVLVKLVEERYAAEDEPGTSVLVICGADTQMVQRGMADLSSGTAITASTNFRLASVAKQFTAACVLRLEEEGRLRLGQRLTDFFPDFPEYGWGITVEHLLRHTSGIKDYEPLVAEREFAEPVMDAEVLALLAEQNEADFEAGSRFRYSNSGYAVLSQIVEQVAGVPFAEVLKGAFFDALGMETSVAFVNRPGAAEVPNRSIGYALDADGAFVWSDQGSTSAVLGDGGIYTSAVDYEKWIRGYCEGRVLKPETVERAWRPGMTTSGEVVPYGYGWRLEERGGKWRPYHPGSTTGFRNGVVLDPEAGVIVLVLSNRANGDAVALAKAIENAAE